MRFKKGNISWNLGKKMSDEARRNISQGHKGQIPWNKALPIIKECEICGKDFTDNPARMKIARFCSHPCYGNWRRTIKLSEETKKKIGISNLGHIVSEETKRKIGKANGGKNAYWFGKKMPKELIRKFLKRRAKSSLEEKFEKIIKIYNLPYRFVGNGDFFIERKNPDFININGEKIAIEVYARMHKNLFRGGLEKWKKERSDIFKKYGWQLLFFDETQVNNKYVLKIIEKGGE